MIVEASKWQLCFQQAQELSNRKLDCLIELMLIFCFLPSAHSHSFFGFEFGYFLLSQQQLDYWVWYFLMSWWFLMELNLFNLFRVCFYWAYHIELLNYWTCCVMINQFIAALFFDFEVFEPNLIDFNFQCKLDFIFCWKMIALLSTA